jgi:hypothetical protein
MSGLVTAVSLHHQAGNDLLLEFTVSRDGEAVDINGMTIRFVVRRTYDSDPVLTTEGGDANAAVTLTAPMGGVFTVGADADATAGLSGTYRFEAQVEDGSDAKQTVARGFITFEPSLI